jgi:hypothetical protein
MDPDTGSFYHQAKIVRKTLDSNWFVTSFFLLLSLKNDVNVPSKSNKHFKKICFCWRLEGQ